MHHVISWRPIPSVTCIDTYEANLKLQVRMKRTWKDDAIGSTEKEKDWCLRIWFTTVEILIYLVLSVLIIYLRPYPSAHARLLVYKSSCTGRINPV